MVSDYLSSFFILGFIFSVGGEFFWIFRLYLFSWTNSCSYNGSAIQRRIQDFYNASNYNNFLYLPKKLFFLFICLFIIHKVGILYTL